MVPGVSALGRVVAWMSRIEWRGILRGLRPGRVERSGAGANLHLHLQTEDTERPGETWDVSIVVRLRDEQDEDQWMRSLMMGLADALGHELGEAVAIDGAPVASIHDRPRVWPWRPLDMEET